MWDNVTLGRKWQWNSNSPCLDSALKNFAQSCWAYGYNEISYCNRIHSAQCHVMVPEWTLKGLPCLGTWLVRIVWRLVHNRLIIWHPQLWIRRLRVSWWLQRPFEGSLKSECSLLRILRALCSRALHSLMLLLGLGSSTATTVWKWEGLRSSTLRWFVARQLPHMKYCSYQYAGVGSIVHVCRGESANRKERKVTRDLPWWLPWLASNFNAASSTIATSGWVMVLACHFLRIGRSSLTNLTGVLA